MTSNYVVWKNKRVANGCVLNDLKGVPKIFQLRKGISRLAGFGEDAVYKMKPDRERDMIVPDSVFNTELLIVASARLKDYFEKLNIPWVEYLPITLLDHKGKPVKDPCYIINALDPVDCLDVDKCEATWSKMVPDDIDELKHLVIDETKIDPQRQLFRCKHYYRVVLVKRELAMAIEEAGFTGIGWLELDKYVQ